MVNPFPPQFWTLIKAVDKVSHKPLRYRSILETPISSPDCYQKWHLSTKPQAKAKYVCNFFHFLTLVGFILFSPHRIIELVWQAAGKGNWDLSPLKNSAKPSVTTQSNQHVCGR